MIAKLTDPNLRLSSPACRRIGLCRLEGSRAPLAHFVCGFTKALRRSLRAFSHFPGVNFLLLSHPAPTHRRGACLAIYQLSW